jgi:hypothetical protein
VSELETPPPEVLALLPVMVDAYLVVKDRFDREVFRKTLLQGRDAFYETEAEFRGIRWVGNDEIAVEAAGEYYSGPSSLRIGR